MEPERITCSNCSCELSIQNYLKEAIKISKENGAVFILDEMVTGFKIDLPGAISKYKLNPDLATWGKGIANGFSFCALTGKKEIMELGGIKNVGEEKVFLTSTTHGGETHSIRAAIQTIKIFKNKRVVEHNHSIGKNLIIRIDELLKSYKIQKSIVVIPCPWIVGLAFKDMKGNDCSVHRTFFLQEMIKENILFQGVFIPCYEHKKKELDFFMQGFENVVRRYIKVVKEKSILKKLSGQPTKPVFRKFL